VRILIKPDKSYSEMIRAARGTGCKIPSVPPSCAGNAAAGAAREIPDIALEHQPIFGFWFSREQNSDVPERKTPTTKMGFWLGIVKKFWTAV